MAKIHDNADLGEKKYVFGEAPDQHNDKKPEKAKDDEKDEKKEEKKKDDGPPPVSFLTLFRFSTRMDRFVMSIGVLAGMISGFTNPLIIILLGWMLDKFVGQEQMASNVTCLNSNIPIFNASGDVTLPPTDFLTTLESQNSTGPSEEDFAQKFMDEFMRDCQTFSLSMAGIALSQFFLSFIIVFTLSRTAENQAFRIRKAFMQAILRQEVGWFDTHQTGDFASRITADLGRIQDGIGEKLGICLFFYATTLISLIAALVYGWKLTLVILSIMPVLVLSTSLIAKLQAKVSGDELSAYGKAGAVAEEVLSSIRTVAAFGGERKEIQRYEKELVTAKKNGIRRGLLNGISMGLVWFCIYGSYALAFWYGTGLVLESRCVEGGGEYSASILIIVFFCVLTAAMFVGQTTPYMEAFAMARGAAAKIFAVIERVPLIDGSSVEGERPSLLIGRIKFEDVHFKYPARVDVPVLQGLSLEAVPGETVALVGPSGCGKSTVIQLLQRFYDTDLGQVKIDGRDIRELNVGWLRDNIGVVGQEPVLFATTIAENIRYGQAQASEDDIIRASKSANAHDFIMKLPQNYQTMIGERGTQLSGGQKQRVAIARALIRNPKILLLDEATSALDTESESVVQAALDGARIGRTTLVVAHRLSTIRGADKIVAIENGQVKEIGSHDQLMELKGLYFQLVTNQQTALSVVEHEEPDLDDEEDAKRREEAANRKNLERHFSISSTVSNGSTGSFGRHSLSLTAMQIQQQAQLGNLQASEVAFPEDDEDANANPDKHRLMKMTAPEWPYVLVGCLASLLMGLSIPFYGILFGDILMSLGKDEDEARRETHILCLVFLGMGIASAIVSFLQSFMFSVVAERLTLRIRRDVFTMMITQEMSWFDDPANGTGALSSRLSADAAQVQGAGGSRMSTILQSLSTLAMAIVIALIYEYRLGLVVLSFVPIVLLATFLETRVVSGHLLSEKAAFEKATKVAVEAIENVRTVCSLHIEELFYKQYVDALAVPHRNSRKKSYMRGFTFGISQCVPNMAYSVSMYYGSVLIYQTRNLPEGDRFTYGDLFKVLEGVILGCMMIGQAVAFAPDYQRAKVSAVRVFQLLDKVSQINPFSTQGKKPTESQGDVVFRGVHFCYPTRKETRVLRGLNFSAQPGQTVALVGSSGCGKSTCVQLLERFYDIGGGELLLDDIEVRELNLAWLRSQVGLVSQEPVLFGYSIAENIAYGDNSRVIPMEEIIDAARKANIHTFVESLPAGYETNVGDRGTQLSGGQKQRIAIARALIRNPNILLLDEATSALDTESEKVVQEALDKAREGRTCIVIAHRLTTIQNADQIVVIHKGRIVEKGTHHELLAKQGFYFKLHSIQAGKST